MQPHVYTVTPEFAGPGQFAERVADTARRTEAVGWRGILVPHNLEEVDPWIVAGHVLRSTQRLVPLIAVQPACTPPQAAAAMTAALAALYGRAPDLNLVAGAREGRDAPPGGYALS